MTRRMAAVLVGGDGWRDVNAKSVLLWASGFQWIADGCPGLSNALTGVVEIHGVLLDADEVFARVDAGDAGRAAAHEGVENRRRTGFAADELHLCQRAWTGDRIVAFVAVVGCKVDEVPIPWHFTPKPRLLTPEDNRISA